MNDNEIEKLDFVGWPLPDEYLIEIGRVSALWVSVENLLGVCIGKLAGFDGLTNPKPFILVNHSSFPQKLDMLGSLCELLKGEFPKLADCGKVIQKIRAAQSVRNKFVHNTIGPDAETGRMQIAQGTARGKVKTSLEAVRIADIRRAVMEIDEAGTALFKLVFDLDVPPVWRRKHSESRSK